VNEEAEAHCVMKKKKKEKKRKQNVSWLRHIRKGINVNKGDLR
jgi:hypothetical protein